MKYIVKSGDSMKSLAELFLNDEAKWRVIWNINKGRMQSDATPDEPTVGVEIDIPDMSQKPPMPGGRAESEEAVLYINDKVFSGWTDISIKRTIEALAGSFQLGLVENQPGSLEPFIINPFDRCALRVGEFTVIDGYVDSVALGLSAESHSISVAGRDKTCDLVDCPNLNRPGTWKRKKIEQIAQELADPFGIEVTTDVDTGGVINFFRVQPGETIFEALEKECKKKNLLMTTLPDGRLIFSKAGQNSTGVVLQEGVNIKDISFDTDAKNRFSIYEVEGYPKKKGEVDPSKTYKKGKGNGVRNTYDDPDVPRYRPTHITAEGVTNKAASVMRAQWEAKLRAARAESITVTVQGWRLPGWGLWPLNHTVMVKAPSVRIDRELLITGIDLKKDKDQGTSTILTLKRPDAFADLPKFPKKSGVGFSNKVDERFYRPVSNSPTPEKTVQSLDTSKTTKPPQSTINNPTWQWKSDA